jgi:hypothetical protein
MRNGDQRAEDILARHGMACNLEKNTILVDPEGHLTRLHQEVAKGFALRKWVKCRAESQLNAAKSSIKDMVNSRNSIEAVHALCNFIKQCSASITVAHLEPPTHRRTLANLKIIMDSQEEQALFEEILQTFGSAQLTEREVRAYLNHCLNAFDRAIVVKRNPVPFNWKLDPCLRDYLDTGTIEMIEEGAHRESFFWIALFFVISTMAIEQDGLPEEKNFYVTRLMDFLRALGLESAEEIKQRILLCTVLHAKVAEYVHNFIEESSQIRD